MKIDQLLEAVLYFKGEPVSKKELSKILEISKETLEEAKNILKEKLEDRGLVVIETGDDISLGTSGDANEILDKIAKEDMEKDLGRAGIETLTVVAYKGPISRSGIDNIRGVNSSFILRNLSIRGLVEREKDPNDERSFLYKPSMKLIQYLNIKSIEELPEYSNIRNELKTVETIDSENNQNLND